MRKNGYGRIVNISSGYGAMIEMAGYHAAYRISKAALNALTLIMADELSDGDIRVNAVCPGWVSTDMGGKMAPVSAEKAAKDIVHVAMMDKEFLLAPSSDTKNQLHGKVLILIWL
jgi:NAD(P)-dependent dehydrogenase (short-subunit alcohol dehydrogenase family)